MNLAAAGPANLRFTTVKKSDPGRKRPNNEDYATFFEPDDPAELADSGMLYIVADGVGGAYKGERASTYAAQKVLYEYYQHPQTPPADRLRTVIRAAGNEIYDYAESGAHARMATTMVAAVISGDQLTVANVGDSRAYLIRARQAYQITKDHSLVGEMVRGGVMTEEQAQRSNVKNQITRSLGGERDVQVDIFEGMQLQVGDMLLLCTDGLYRYTNLEALATLTAAGQPEEIATRLVEHANRSGGADNITLVLVSVQPADAQAEPTLHGSQPVPVDWDTMQTQTGRAAVTQRIPARAPAPAREDATARRSLRWWVLGGVALVVLVMLGVLFRLLLAPGAAAPTPTASPTAAPASATPEPSATADLTATFLAALPPATETPTLTATPDLAHACVYEVKEGVFVGLSASMTELTGAYDAQATYYYYATCDLAATRCEGTQVEIPPDQHGSIQAGWFLKIDLGLEACTVDKGVTWVEVPETQ